MFKYFCTCNVWKIIIVPKIIVWHPLTCMYTFIKGGLILEKFCKHFCRKKLPLSKFENPPKIWIFLSVWGRRNEIRKLCVVMDESAMLVTHQNPLPNKAQIVSNLWRLIFWTRFWLMFLQNCEKYHEGTAQKQSGRHSYCWVQMILSKSKSPSLWYP